MEQNTREIKITRANGMVEYRPYNQLNLQTFIRHSNMFRKNGDDKHVMRIEIVANVVRNKDGQELSENIIEVLDEGASKLQLATYKEQISIENQNLKAENANMQAQLDALKAQIDALAAAQSPVENTETKPTRSRNSKTTPTNITDNDSTGAN